MTNLRGTHDIFFKIRPKEVFRVSAEYGIESVQLRLGGIVTCNNNNIDKYGTNGGGKG